MLFVQEAIFVSKGILASLNLIPRVPYNVHNDVINLLYIFCQDSFNGILILPVFTFRLCLRVCRQDRNYRHVKRYKEILKIVKL